MVDVDERPEGWNKELYDKLSFEYLIEGSQNNKIEEWNLAYEEYLKSEWMRIFPDKEYDLKNIGELFNIQSDFVKPHFMGQPPNYAIHGIVDLSHAILIGAVFSSIYLGGAYFRWARLDGASFNGINLEHTNFKSANLQKAYLKGANLVEAEFNDAHLNGTHFEGAYLQEADFRSPHLNGTHFKEAHLDGAYFYGAHLKDSSFSEACLSGAVFTQATIIGGVFNKANLKNTFFNAAHLEGVDFTSDDLEGADFSEAYLQDAKFLNAQLKGAIFNNSHLERANFNLARLDGADFLSSKLQDAVFYLARLEGARFNHSNIKGADFSYTLVRGTQFIDVNIDDKTDFTGTYLAELLIHPNLRKHLERNIRKLNITNTSVFVAMKFDSPDLDSALENAIKPACFACDGLEACTVNEKAGDGWIPQRIKEEIQDARFVISDLTYRNPGVYYETGYADGLEIPVIQTCKRSWYDKEKDPLHFDIAQRNTIFWKDNEDLKQQLIMKIKELQETGK